MESTNERRARFERYLLGGLDEVERQQIREQAIVDADVYAELREVEIDLLDEAARGTLDAERMRLVREHVIEGAGESRNAAWALAQGLAARRARKGAGESARVAEAETVFAGRHQRAGRRFVWLAAAAVVLISATSVYFGWRSRLASPQPPPGVSARNEPDARRAPGDIPLPEQTRDPEAPATSHPAAASGTASEATSPSPSSASRGESAGASSSVRTPAVLAVYFPAATLRGPKPLVRLDAAVRELRLSFEIDLDAAAPASSVSPPRAVDVTIRAVPAAASAPLWSARDVPVRAQDGTRIATIEMPASLLKSGSYEASLAVSASAAGPAAPAAATPRIDRIVPFSVQRD